MRNKLLMALVAVALVAAGAVFMKRPKMDASETVREVSPRVGPVRSVISSNGTVLPKNRLEIKPPVNGRVERILVREGERVKKGQTLGWMSSTERAALLDAAQGQGEDKLKYWQEVYKPIALVAPIDGEVIVATVQPGQAVTTGEPVLVLSDRLIVRAQVDETDIGKIKEGQRAAVSLDAYPGEKVEAEVGHIYYESETVNNVTIYKVDLVPAQVPVFFRSGMNANIDFVADSREDALLLPEDAVMNEDGGQYVLVKSAQSGEPVRHQVTLGMAEGKNVEIISGITADDVIVVKSRKYALPKAVKAKNPLIPERKRGTGGGRR